MNTPSPEQTKQQSGRFLRMPDVVASVGLSKATINRLHRIGQFPPKRRLSTSSVGWWEGEIQDWKAARPTADKNK